MRAFAGSILFIIMDTLYNAHDYMISCKMKMEHMNKYNKAKYTFFKFQVSIPKLHIILDNTFNKFLFQIRQFIII